LVWHLTLNYIEERGGKQIPKEGGLIFGSEEGGNEGKEARDETSSSRIVTRQARPEFLC